MNVPHSGGPAIDAILEDRGRYGVVRLYHGARTPVDRPHKDDLAAWSTRRDIEFGMTVDRFGNSQDKRAEPRYPAPTAPTRPRGKGATTKFTAPAYYKFESIFLQP